MTQLVIGCDFGLRKSGVVAMDLDFNIVSENLLVTSSTAAKRLHDIEMAFDHVVYNLSNYEKLTFFIEGYNFGAAFQRESLAELGGVMRRYFYTNNLDYWVVPPKKLKLFVTGNGAANKNFMKKCTKERWGLDFKSDDVCDAHGLSRLGVTTLRTLSSLDTEVNDRESAIIGEMVSFPDEFMNASTSKRRKKGIK